MSDKPLTYNELQLTGLRMLTAMYMAVGETDVGDTLRWAVNRIEVLERATKVQACCTCPCCSNKCNSQHDDVLRNEEGSVVLPFRR